MEILHNLINGQLVDPVRKRYLDVENPALGMVYAKAPESSEEDLAQAVSAAENAFPDWARTPITERGRILNKIADLIEERFDELALVESKDTGKPLSLSKRMDIPRAAANFRFFAAAVQNFSTEAHVNDDHSVNYTHRSPLGIVGCISPWNLPLYLFSWKIAPALAMGNCVIGKPSEITPYTAWLLSKIVMDAGLPPGVLNILHGSGSEIGQAIVSHPKIHAISFTGGTVTGRKIGQIAAETFKKTSLELGGKNPVLVFESCDLDEAVSGVVRSSFTNQGEICLCGSRILVQESIYGEFVDRFVKATSQLKVGDPLDPKTNLGALISKAHLEKVSGFVERARPASRILFGGSKIESAGYFYQPTIIESNDPYCEVNQHEIFGPVVTIGSFKSEEEALERANNSTYGLAAVIWTNDLKQAHRVGQGLKSGVVWVNCWLERDLRTPFGGMKQSGIGREGGNDALRFFSEPRNICIKL